MLVASATGFILQATGSYVPIFVWAGFSYLLVLALIHVMIPKIQPITE
jgi:ACS family hexuronate transporter-like MFS transporter